ncbi:hypothetical protein [Janthinobacterium lividum]|uniref:hypothetical protein n=1 Tax=Janthinobacterium lividum TaxID=29581 RepID=UPI001B83D3C3|nr:hypothetical protein [Janthinobacterium lividum]MBR7634506.1 hypothetical protein [Janthinobacterium lividum]
MIPVKLASEPFTFDELVRVPGLRAISEMIGQKPKHARKAGKPYKKIARSKNKIPPDKFPAYWTHALDSLMISYNQICAYSAFRIHPVTGARSADHMVAKSHAWRQVYEWNNYRLACSRLNSRKKDFFDVIDPFLVKHDWFVLNIFTFEIEAAPRLDAAIAKKISDTIIRLDLNDFKHHREEYAEDYLKGEISLRILKKEAPFIAYELFRQKKLLAGDVY